MFLWGKECTGRLDLLHNMEFCIIYTLSSQLWKMMTRVVSLTYGHPSTSTFVTVVFISCFSSKHPITCFLGCVVVRMLTNTMRKGSFWTSLEAINRSLTWQFFLEIPNYSLICWIELNLKEKLGVQRNMVWICGTVDYYLQPGYYDMPLQPPTTLTGRDQNSLASVPYTGQLRVFFCVQQSLTLKRNECASSQQ